MSDDKLPQPGSLTRFLGVHPDGHVVNNVNERNRYDQAPGGPTAPVTLLSEDQTKVLGTCRISNTRERPDVIMYGGVPFLVVQTMAKPFTYRAVMWLQGE